MLTTNDSNIAEKARILRKHGLSTDAWKRHTVEGSSLYDVVAPGFNYCMTDVQAALGRGQLMRLPEMNAARGRLAARYDTGLSSVEEIETPNRRSDVVHAWHLYTVRLRLEGLRIDRNQFDAELRKRSIGTAVTFIPIHYHSFYREGFNFHKGDYPVAEGAFERLISLPLFPAMTDADVDRVVAAIEEIVDQNRI